MAYGKRGNGFGLRKHVAYGLITMAVLFGGTGLNCSSDTLDIFRQEAASEIGDGVKSIMNGILDGIIATLSQTDDSSSSS